MLLPEEIQLVCAADALSLDLVHVFLHQHNLLNQAVKVRGHGVQELIERNIDFFHFLL